MDRVAKKKKNTKRTWECYNNSHHPYGNYLSYKKYLVKRHLKSLLVSQDVGCSHQNSQSRKWDCSTILRKCSSELDADKMTAIRRERERFQTSEMIMCWLSGRLYRNDIVFLTDLVWESTCSQQWRVVFPRLRKDDIQCLRYLSSSYTSFTHWLPYYWAGYTVINEQRKRFMHYYCSRRIANARWSNYK